LAAKGERTGVGSWSGLGSGAEASQLLLPNTLSLSSIVTAIANIPLLRNRYQQSHRSSSAIKRGQCVDAVACRWSKAAAKQQQQRRRRQAAVAAECLMTTAYREEKTLHNKTTKGEKKCVTCQTDHTSSFRFNTEPKNGCASLLWSIGPMVESHLRCEETLPVDLSVAALTSREGCCLLRRRR